MDGLPAAVWEICGQLYETEFLLFQASLRQIARPDQWPMAKTIRLKEADKDGYILEKPWRQMTLPFTMDEIRRGCR